MSPETSEARRYSTGPRQGRSPKQTGPERTATVGRLRGAQVAAQRGAYDALTHLFGDHCQCRTCSRFRAVEHFRRYPW